MRDQFGVDEDDERLIDDLVRRRRVATAIRAATKVLASKTTVYRGTGKNTGKAVWGPGRYYTDNRALAEKYGQVQEHQLDTSKMWNGEDDFTTAMLKKLTASLNDKDLADALTWGNTDYRSLYRNLASVFADRKGGRDKDFYDNATYLLSSFLKDQGYTGIRYPASAAGALGSSERIEGFAYVVFL